jgi:hypothetical protein
VSKDRLDVAVRPTGEVFAAGAARGGGGERGYETVVAASLGAAGLHLEGQEPHWRRRPDVRAALFLGVMTARPP